MKNTFSRRHFLQFTGLSSLGLLAGLRLKPARAQSTFTPDIELSLTAEPGEVAIYDGASTRAWRYQAEVLSGDSRAVQALPDVYPGPVLRFRQGQKVRIRYQNNIPEESIVHWHGLHVPDTMDGQPRHVIGVGETFDYEFEVISRAGTYWYHPHPHERTGYQVYHGMAGFFLVSDETEDALDLPGGDYDIPLVIQDRTFDADNQFVYLPNGFHDQMMGFLGDHILVNGQPDYTLNVATRPYRLRLLNGSNSRLYKLAWNDGTPLNVIGTDGGLLEAPVQKPYIMLAPAQRIELWVDFSNHAVGDELTLQNLEFSDGSVEGMMMNNPALYRIPQGSQFDVMRVRVTEAVESDLSLPAQLAPFERYNVADARNADAPRTFPITMRQMQWYLNGRTYEMNQVAGNEVVALDALEVWQFDNQQAGGMGRGMGGGGMGMMLYHPIHVHGVQFQVVGREINSTNRDAWETVREGFVDEGLHDTVAVMPGERVSILTKLAPYSGMYLYHCHILEHEDMGMMRNYVIGI